MLQGIPCNKNFKVMAGSHCTKTKIILYLRNELGGI